MKKLSLLLCFLIMNLALFSKSKKLPVYVSKLGVTVTEYDFLNKSLTSNSKEVIPPNTLTNKFAISEDGTGYIIIVLNFDTSGYAEAKSLNKITSKMATQFDRYTRLNQPNANQLFKYFYVPKALFDENFQLVPSAFQVTGGLITLPFKYRINSKSFTSDFSLGTSGGVQIKMNRFATNSVSGLFAIGMTTVNLDTSMITLKSEETFTNRSAISFAGGLNFSFQGLNLGMFLGKDCLIPKNTIGWIDNGKLWYSIGIGINIFKREIGISTNGSN